jgi:DNA-binding transcriptional MerR regulator
MQVSSSSYNSYNNYSNNMQQRMPRGGEGENPLSEFTESMSDEEKQDTFSKLHSLTQEGRDELKSQLDELKENSEDMSSDELTEAFTSILDEVADEYTDTSISEGSMPPPPPMGGGEMGGMGGGTPPPPPPQGENSTLTDYLDSLSEDDQEDTLSSLMNLTREGHDTLRSELESMTDELSEMTDEEASTAISALLEDITSNYSRSNSTTTSLFLNAVA